MADNSALFASFGFVLLAEEVDEVRFVRDNNTLVLSPTLGADDLTDDLDDLDDDVNLPPWLLLLFLLHNSSDSAESLRFALACLRTAAALLPN